MGNTRSRKRAHMEEGAESSRSSTSTEAVEQADSAFERANEATVQEKKQRRMEPPEHRGSPFEMLDETLYKKIFLYLDSARDVQSLAFCTKYLRDCLTPEIVIRAAVFEGDKSRTAIGSVMGYIKQQSIHVPSTLRLLRLVNSTRCERGNQCFGYNEETELPASMSKHSLRPFGLAICSSCAWCASNWCRSDLHFVHERFAIMDEERRKILTYPHVESVTNEKAGPLVSEQELKQILKTYLPSTRNVTRALDKVFQSLDDTQDIARGRVLVDVFETAEIQYKAFEQAKQDSAIQIQNTQNLDHLDGRTRARIERASNRRKKALVVFGKIESLLEGYTHKDLVLECSWDDEEYCHFAINVVDLELGCLLRAPSTATRKKLTAAVNAVKRVIELLDTNGFLSGPNFLSFLVDSDQPHLQLLYRFCVAEYSQNNELLNNELFVSYRYIYRYDNGRDKVRDAVRGIEQGRPVDALLQFIGYKRMEGVFPLVVQEFNHRPRDKLSSLAKELWMSKLQGYYWRRPLTDSTFREKVRECRQEYITLRKSIKDYLKDPGTIAFLRRKDADERFTPRDAVNKMYSDHYSISFLRSRNFEGLRRIHIKNYENPSFEDLHDAQAQSAAN